MNKFKMGKVVRSTLLSLLCAVCFVCAVFACVNFLNDNKNHTAEAGTTISGTIYTLSGTPEEMSAGWVQAVMASSESKTITVRFGNDWIAENGSFGSGSSAFSSGALCVPAGRSIYLQLYGYRIDRGLTKAVDGGSVFVVKGKLILSMDAKLKDSNGNGIENQLTNVKITGGWTTGNGGGILVDGGELNIECAEITGNKANGNGGGIYLNKGSKLVFGSIGGRTGRTILNNTVNGKENNVYLQDGQKIENNAGNSITTDWRQITKVGITLENGTGVFTDKYFNGNSKIHADDLFVADNTIYTVSNTDYGNTTECEAQIVSATQDDNSTIAKKWNQAVYQSLITGKQVEFTLTEDWSAVDNEYEVTSFGHGFGFVRGCINVPYGTHIKLNLNGRKIDRRLVGHVNGKNRIGEFSSVIEIQHGTLDIVDATNTGEIRGGDASSGAIVVTQYGYCNLYGGKITENNTTSYGTFIASYGTLSVYGGEISNNTGSSAYNYSMIYVADNSSVYIYDGLFKNNTGGGGIGYTNTKNRLRIYGGTFTGNTATRYGAVIALDNTYGVTVLEATNGKEIVMTNNVSAQAGGAIRATAGSRISLKGKVRIENNTLNNGTTSNLYFSGATSANAITITDTIASGSKIGVAFQKSTGQITTGFGEHNGNTDVSSVFFADNTGYKIAKAIGVKAEAILITESDSGDFVCMPIAVADTITYNGDWQNIIYGYNSEYMSIAIRTASPASSEGITLDDINTTADGYIQGKRAGNYYINVTLKKGKWADGSTDTTRYVGKGIAKADYDMTGIYMENARVKYNDANKTNAVTLIGASLLPSTLTLEGYTYLDADGTEITNINSVQESGDYTVIANIVNNDQVNYNDPAQISAVLSISNTVGLPIPYFEGVNTVKYVKFSASAQKFTIGTYVSGWESNLTITCDNGVTRSGNTLTLKAKATKGTYNITFEIKDTNSYMWADDESIEMKTLTIEVSNYDYVTAPTVTAKTGLTYNGASQSVLASNTVTLNSALNSTKNWTYSLDGSTYSATAPSVTNAGKYKIYWRFRADGYEPKDGVTDEFEVAKYNINGFTSSQITLSAFSCTYNGADQTPTPTVTINALAGSKTLATTEYTFTYTNNRNAGTATLKVVGSNKNFTGTSATFNFTIAKKNLSSAIITAIGDKTYTGADIKPTSVVKIVLSGTTQTTLTAGTHFTWDYTADNSDLKNVGDNKTIRIKAVDNSNYTGYCTVTFNIVQATLHVTLGGAGGTYNGLDLRPTTVTFGNNGSNGLLGTDGDTITESAVLERLSLEYGSESVTEAIIAGAYTATVDWPTSNEGFKNYKLATNCNAVTGYSFNIAKATITAGNVTIAGNSWTFDGQEHSALLPGTAPSVSGIVEGNSIVWQYSKDGSAWASSIGYTHVPSGGTTYTAHYKVSIENYNDFEGTFSVNVSPREMSTAGIAFGTVSPLTYTGLAQTPTYTVQDTVGAGNVLTLTEGTDFTAIASNNVNAGDEAVLTLTGKGDYTGTVALKFSIKKQGLTAVWANKGTPDYSDAGAEHYIYDGTAQGYTVSVTGAVNGETVTLQVTFAGTDFAGNAISDMPKTAGAGYTVTAELVGYDNYYIINDTELSKTFAIDRREITAVSGITAKNREYDGGTVAELVYTGAQFGNIVTGDNLTAGGAVGAFEKAGIGTWDVAITGITLGGDDSYNYTLKTTTATASAKIEKRVLELVWTDTKLLFNGTARLPSVSASNVVDGETLSFRVEAVGAPAINPAEGYTARATLLAGQYSDNYALPADPTCEFEIYSNNIVVYVDGTGLTYNGNALLPVFKDGSGNVMTLVEGTDFTVTLSAKVGSALTDGKAVNAGEYTAVLSISPAYMWWDNATYETKKSIDFTIEKAETDISGVSFGNITHTYNGALPAISVGELPAGVANVTYTYLKGDTAISANEAVNAGTYTVVAEFTLDGNHKFANETVDRRATLTVNRAEIDLGSIDFEGVTGGSASLTYDGKAHSLSLSGTADGLAGVTYTYTKNNQTVQPSNVVGAGTYTVVATFTPDSNHVIIGSNTKSATLNILQAPLTVVANDRAIVYGDAPTDGGATFNGLVGGENESVLGALSFTIDYVRYGNIGEFAIVVNPFAGAGASNYDIKTVAGKLTVTPLEVQVKWQRSREETSTDFTYTQSGSTRFAPYATVTNAVNGDILTLTVSGATNEAGFDFTAEVTAIGGAKSGNYRLPVSGAKTAFTVMPEPKSGKIIWDNATLYYNGSAQLPKAYYYASDADTNPVELDVICAGSTSPVNAGTYTAKVTNNLGLSGNTTKTFTIEKREIYIKIGNLNVVCGQEADLSKVTWNYVSGSAEFLANENYTISFNCDYTAGATGTFAIRASFASANSSNYKVVFTGDYASSGEDNGKWGVLTVAKGTFDPDTLTYLGTEVTYDGNKHVLTALGLPEGVEAVMSYKKGEWSYGADGVVGAGTYTVTVDFKYDPAVYNSIKSVTVTMTVKKATLEIKANDVEIIYGEDARNGGYTVVSGLVAGDTENAIGGAISFTFGGYTPASGVGRYVITPSGLTSENYEISYIPGALTVSPRTITVTWFDYEANGTQGTHFVYKYTNGESEFAPYALAGGLVNGDSLELPVTGGRKTAGTGYIARATISDPNYKLPEDGTEKATFDILPDADNVVVWESEEVVYGDGAYVPVAYYFKDGEKKSDLTVTVYSDEACTKPASAVNAGTYYAKATLSGVTLSNDVYSFTVAQREIHIVIGNVNSVYGDVLSAFKATYAEGSAHFVGSDTIETLIALTCTAGEKPSAGTYKITGAYNGDGNYKVIITDGTLTVARKTVTNAELPALVGASVNYDGKAHTLTADISGEMISGVKYVYFKVADGKRTEISASEVIGAGDYMVRAVYTLSPNFVLANGENNFVEASLKINKAVLSGSLSLDTSVTEFTYDGKPHTLLVTGTATGVKEITYKYYKVGTNGNEEITAQQAVSVGTYRVEVSLTFDNDNYTYGGDNPLAGTFKITPASLKLSLNGTLVYGDEHGLTAKDIEAEGFVGSDTLESIGLNVSIDVRYGGSYGTGVKQGGYAIVLSGSQFAGNYKVTYAGGTLTVIARTLTADDFVWFSNEACTLQNFTYVYTGAEYHPYAKVKDGVLVSGDSLALEYGAGKTQIGFGYTVKVTGTGNPNYVLPASGITSRAFDILEQPVKEYEIVWDYATLYYNGDAQRPDAYYYADKDGDPIKLNVVVDEGSAIGAGTYTARVVETNVKLTGETSIKFSIEKREVFIRVGDTSAVYGETPNMQAVEWSYEYEADEKTHVVAGDAFTVSFSCETVAGVGKYKISGHFSSNKGANYAVTFTGGWASADADNGKYGTLTVTKANLDLSGVVVSDTDAVYSGLPNKVTLTNVPANVGYKITYANGAFGYGENGATDAGVYTVTITYFFNDSADAENYNPLPERTETLTVRKASLTVKAKDKTIVYGDEVTGFEVDIQGFVNGETLSSSDVTGGAEYTVNYNRYGAVGKYRITVSGFASGNYTVNYVAGALTVEKRVLTVEWFDDETRSSQTFAYKYDGVTVYCPYAVAGNTVNGDKVILTVAGGTSEQGAGYVAEAHVADGNYALPADGTASVKFDIIPEAKTIVWEMTPFHYNGTAQKPTAFYYGEDGEKHYLTVNVEGEHTNAGTYTARAEIPAGLSLNGRYSYTYEISKLNISIIIKDVNAVFGEDIPWQTEWWTYAQGSDKFAGSDADGVTRGNANTNAVGTFAIGATFNGNTKNYDVTFTAGTLTVEKAKVAGTPVFTGAQTADYDGNVHLLTVDITGLTGVTGVTLTYEKDGVSYGANGVTEAGEYTVIAHFTADGNHIAPADIVTTLKVNAKEIDLESQISFRDVTDAVYNGIAHSVLISGTADGVTGVTYEYRNSDGKVISESEVIGKGDYTVKATFTADKNHGFKNNLNYLTATITVNPAHITVKADGASVVYGETVKASGYTVTGLVAGDTETSIGLSVKLTITGYTAGVTGVGTLPNAVGITASVASANYEIDDVQGADLTVIPRTIKADEVTWYDEKDGTAGTRFEYTYKTEEGVPVVHTPYPKAVIGGKTLTFKVEGGQSEIGDNYTAKITAVNDPNYALPVGGISITFSVMGEQKSGVIIWDNTELYYNGENRQPTAYYLIDGDDEKHYLTVSVSGSSALAGSYTATVSPDPSLNLTGATSMPFKVLPLPVIIVIGDAQATYGEAVTLDKWDYADGSAHFLDGESFTIRLTYGGEINVGKYKIYAEFRSANSANYDVKFTGGWTSGDADNGKYGTLTIVKANIDISALTVEGTQVNFDGNSHGVTVKGLPAGVTAYYSYSLNGWSVAPENVKGAGVYNVIITFKVDDVNNYNSIPAMTATLTINQAVVTVTAYDYTIVYGDRPMADPRGAMVTGVDPSELKGTLTFTFDYKQYGSAGKYSIIPSGYTSDNYVINFVAGVLTVEKRIVTLEWFDDDTLSSKNFKYSQASDGTVFRPFAVAGNLVNGDTLSLVISGGSSEAGLNFVATVTDTGNANYALPSDGSVSQSFDVVPASKVIVWDNTQLYYNGEKQAPEAYYFDENGKKVPLTVTVNGDTGVSAVGGTYIATVTETGLTGAYTYTFDILPREITIVIADKTAVFGNVEEVLKTLTCKLADGSLGFVGGDTIAIIALSCTATDESGAGTYAITASCANGNYNVTVIAGTLTVTKAQVSVSGITFAGMEVAFDGSVRELSADISKVDGIAGVTYEYYLKNSDGTKTLVGNGGVKTAGEYEVVATFTIDGNHEFAGANYKTATLLIMQAQISGSVDFANGSFTYDGTVKELHATTTASGITGVTYKYYAGDFTGAGATLPSEMTGGAINAGVYTVVATFTVDGNYLPIDAKRAKLTIDKAELTVTANDVNKTYGYNYNEADFGYTYAGLATGDNFANLALGVNITVNYGGANTGVNTYEISISGLEDVANYKVVYVNGKLTISPRVLSTSEIKWQVSADNDTALLEYEYDGAEHLPYAYAKVGDTTIVIAVTGAQVNAGIGYLAVATGVDNPNFALPAESVTARFTINPKPVDLHVVWENTEVYYDGTAHAPKVYYTVEGDAQKHYLDITVDGLAEVTNAGVYTAKATLADENLTLAGSDTAVFTILRGKVYIEISDANVSYGEVSAFTAGYAYVGGMRLDATAEASLKFTCSADDTTDIGKYAIVGSFDGDTFKNYEVIFTGSWASADANNGKCGTLTIGKATVNMSGITVSDRKVVYNGSYQKYTVSNLPAGVEASYSYTLGGWGFGNDGVKNAGVYEVTVKFSFTDGRLAKNYYPIADLTDEFTVTRAPLTVKAKDNSITYGDEASANGASFTGFADGEDERMLSGSPEYGFDYTRYGKAGTYVITVSGLTSANYDVTFENGVLTVKPREITISWYSENGGIWGTEFNYKYDGAMHLPYAVAGNTVNNETLVLSVEGAQHATGMNYVARVTAIFGNPNYVLPEDGSAQVYFNILPDAYTIVWESTQFVYNGEKQAPKAYYFTQYGGRVELKVTTDRYPADAGEYVAYASAYPGDTTPITGDFEHVYTIEKLAVSIIIHDSSSQYGDPLVIDPNGWSYAEGSGEFKDGNFITLNCSVNVGDNVGKYENAITCDYSNPNYDITFRNGSYTVVKKVLDIPVFDTIDYDGKPHTPAVEDGAPYYIASSSANITKTDVGVYDVTLGLKDVYNYEWKEMATPTVIVTFEIKKVNNGWISGYEFGVQGGTVEAGSGRIEYNEYRPIFDSDITVKYYRDAGYVTEVTEEYVSTYATLGEKFYVLVTVAGSNNFNVFVDDTVTVTVVGKLKVTLEWLEETMTYDGFEQAPRAFIWIGKERVWLDVAVNGGPAIFAGDYTATAKRVALDGTDLSGYEFTNAESDFTKTFTIEARAITVTITEGVSVVYGSVKAENADFSRVVWSITSGRLAENDNRDDLNVTFSADFGEGEYANAGAYDIVGSWNNTNYTVEFLSSAGAVYEVTKAVITVNKTGSEWVSGQDGLDDGALIDTYQNYFVTLDEKDADGAYKYLNLKGDQSAEVRIRYSSLAYNFKKTGDIPLMTDKQIAQYIDENQESAPSIRQAGIWVIYYRIEEANHQTKYGQWRVLILKNTDYVTINFEKPYQIQYGDATDKNIISELIDGGYISVSGAITDLEILRRYAEAYAYEDLSSGTGVSGSTGVNSYTIRFEFNANGMAVEEFANVEFRYKNTNDPDKPDTNVGAFEVQQRVVTAVWGVSNFVYDGTAKLPALKITGFVGGQAVELETKIGETTAVTLANGDIVHITVSMLSGSGAVNAGSYRLAVTLDNPNYRFDLASSTVDVTIARQELEVVWGEKQFIYDGEAHTPLLTVGGKQVGYDLVEGSQTVAITLDNGDTVEVIITLVAGKNTKDAGTYTLQIALSNDNYTVSSANDRVTVSVTDTSKIGLPTWAIGVIIGVVAFAVLVIIILAVVLKKRKKQVAMIDDDGFNDDVSYDE